MEGSIANRDAQALMLMRRLPVDSLHKLHDALETLVTHGLSQVEDMTSLREAPSAPKSCTISAIFAAAVTTADPRNRMMSETKMQCHIEI